jgi:hypothetical protein
MNLPLPQRRLIFYVITCILLLTSTLTSFSQNQRKVGTVSSFTTSINKQKRSGKPFTIKTTDTSYHGHFNYSGAEMQKNKFIGNLKTYSTSTIYFNIENNQLEGKVIIPEIEKAYKYQSDTLGDVYVTEVPIDHVICINYRAPLNSVASANSPTPLPSAVLNLQSLPGAEGVVLLDFDGHYVSGTYWNGGNPIDALPALLSENEIIEIWNLVSEDYRPFNLNITTSESVYQAAQKDKRMRCIFTPTTTAAPGTGGIAYVGSFTWGTDTPCWVFNTGIKGAGEAASHEIGHTLGLSHDGRLTPQEEYYYGTEDWAPIMGIGYYSRLVQWSKGEYKDASNLQDDIDIIAFGTAKLGFRPDESDQDSYKELSFTSTGEIISDQTGIITNEEDEDVYYFSTSGGPATISIVPTSSYPNLNIEAYITDTKGGTIAYSNPETSLSSDFSLNLKEGTYFLHIKGSGKGNPVHEGYSAYGSIGEYLISGFINVAPVVNQPPVVSLTKPDNKETCLAPSIELIAEAKDQDGVITKVEFYNGKTKIGEDSIPPFSYIWKTAPVGISRLTAKATDNKGAYTISPEITITVQKPAAIIYQHCSYQLSGYAIGLDTGYYTTEKLVSFGIQDKDISGIKVTDGYEIVLFQDNHFKGTSLTLRVNDNCLYDNKLNDSVSSLLIREIPNLPPTVIITSPQGGTVITEGTDLTITAEATDTDGDIVLVEFFRENEKLFTTSTTPYTYTLSKITTGTYHFKVVVTDNKGATTASEVVSVKVITSELPVGINGPSCIETERTYEYTLNNDLPTTNVSWWSNSDVRLRRDGSDYRKVYVNFSPYNPTTVSLHAGVNFSVAPFYKEYSMLIILSKCPDTKRASIHSSPHPFISTTSVSIDNGDPILSVKIYDLQGKEVYSSGSLNSDTIEIGEHLSQGLYILKVTTPAGGYTRTILKN